MHTASDKTSFAKNKLAKVIKKYNDTLKGIVQKNHDYNLGIFKTYIVPIKNGTKAYCHIISGRSNTIHIFSKQEFFIETSRIFDTDLLLEGYMYTSECGTRQEYRITDVLVIGDEPITSDYPDRYEKLKQLFHLKNLEGLNNYLDIRLHLVYDKREAHLVNLTDYCCIEYIHNHTKTVKCTELKKEPVYKYVERGAYSDVYNVYHCDTMDYEGILYIKGIKESEILRGYKEKTRILVKFNKRFQKYEPVGNLSKDCSVKVDNSSTDEPFCTT
jgi:hypothetical protein